MEINGNKNKTNKLKFITYSLPQPYSVKYIVIVANRGITIEVNHFISLQQAKGAFKEIALDYGFEPKKINNSDNYDVSIWKLTEDRYKRVFLHI